MRPGWTLLNSTTWVQLAINNAFLVNIWQQEAWGEAGLGWRAVFLVPGELYRRTADQKVYRVMGRRAWARPCWPCVLVPGSADCWQEDTCQEAVWLNMYNWVEFVALPTRPLSPLGQLACGKPLSSMVMLLQCQNPCHALEHAARKGFQGVRKEDIIRLARDLSMPYIGHFPFAFHACTCLAQFMYCFVVECTSMSFVVFLAFCLAEQG